MKEKSELCVCIYMHTYFVPYDKLNTNVCYCIILLLRNLCCEKSSFEINYFCLKKMNDYRSVVTYSASFSNS